ncbi:NAD-dependent protein deacetylase of SIR2 family [Salinisphaera sp. LB1]|nr:NAD-dependent protein deacetylase [Salinisphaera sp. LB1]AWN17788.1 NAD-dependent protein deacetylase of SIR2 family [Salinisphaera sp. LB1]
MTEIDVLMEPAETTRTVHVERLRDFVSRHRRLFVLTGAGMSTDSGIPDYRDRDGGWKGARPIQHQAFISQLSKRRRYWARSMAGWPPVARARPNPGHRALARLGAAGRLSLLVTQNVDGLHQAAGSGSVVDLHGRLDRVVCLDCGTRLSRHRVQDMLVEANRGWLHDAAAMRPDGDIELGDVDYQRFNVPDCPLCSGILKPDVVFFGGAVPRPRVERAWAGLAGAEAVLVSGSSLMVWSGFRFVREAAVRGLPIMAINRGRTRADDLITHKIDDDCGALLDAAID